MSEESADCNVQLIFSVYLHGECSCICVKTQSLVTTVGLKKKSVHVLIKWI